MMSKRFSKGLASIYHWSWLVLLLCTGCNIAGAPVMSRGGAADRADVTDREDVADRADVADRTEVADRADAGSGHGPGPY
jgi:hypothetical protein